MTAGSALLPGDWSLFRIASARAPSSEIGTRCPSRPPSRISLGPLGQLVLTTGVPQARASMSTVGNPSQSDERTKTAAFFIKLCGFLTKPGREKSLVKPSWSAKFWSDSFSFPSPRIIIKDLIIQNFI